MIKELQHLHFAACFAYKDYDPLAASVLPAPPSAGQSLGAHICLHWVHKSLRLAQHCDYTVLPKDNAPRWHLKKSDTFGDQGLVPPYFCSALPLWVEVRTPGWALIPASLSVPGTYIRTSDGRIFAIRTTGKPKSNEDHRAAASGGNPRALGWIHLQVLSFLEFL